MIEIHGLQKSFGQLKVLQDIDLTIDNGDIYGLVGKSGAGKSTLLRCLNGLETYDAGSIRVDGVEVKDLNKEELRRYRKDIAMIFQHFPLMTRKTVYDNIGFPMKCWGYSKKEIDCRVRELAELVGITEKLKEKPAVLSGGQKQRVAIARALSMEPKILLSDESTSALDPGTTHSILGLLRRINKELGITIIVVTHQMQVIRELCNNLALLEKGRLSIDGNVRRLFLEQPEALRRFMMENDAPASSQGVDIQLMVCDEASRDVFSSIGRELGLDYRVIGGKMEPYQEQMLGSLVINIAEADRQRLCDWLDSKKVLWHIYQPNENSGEEAE